uniref:Uncharacterized protein n=1 Tax=Arcella intermedia TaxID=1963864 RepID=A0A6B2LM50_9EUKA
MIPVYMYVSIFGLPFFEFALVYLSMSALVSFTLTLAYKNVAEGFHSRIASRQQSITVAYKVKDKRSVLDELQAKQRAVVNEEATIFAILYNNVFYLFFSVLLAFYGLRAFPMIFNYVLSVGFATGLVLYSSLTKERQ